MLITGLFSIYHFSLCSVSFPVPFSGLILTIGSSAAVLSILLTVISNVFLFPALSVALTVYTPFSTAVNVYVPSVPDVVTEYDLLFSSVTVILFLVIPVIPLVLSSTLKITSAFFVVQSLGLPLITLISGVVVSTLTIAVAFSS